MPKRFTGEIVQGSKRAATLGYPTINIGYTDISVHGVYAAIVLIEAKKYAAAAFGDPSRGVLEAHLLDIEADLYGKMAEIELVEKLRETRTFDSDEALKAMIALDVEKVRAYFAHV